MNFHFPSSNKLGRFTVSHILLEQAIKGEADLTPLFSKVVVLFADNDIRFHGITYTAWSNLFEEVPEGYEIPFYHFLWQADVHEDNSQHITLLPDAARSPLVKREAKQVCLRCGGIGDCICL